ncbi:hypothetical protein BC936DRAFT_146462 [Jimgerdemannia flammicorona]|uniref:Uncharacterized protein n=1 Tax=Jimgerdemannia flammicorona TaxID=994334 RepID=A0A433D8A2_9FUNG|nr:hypothetical protein BC936DRAFT_146462 [Jimgerdemannia flammicorona]
MRPYVKMATPCLDGNLIVVEAPVFTWGRLAGGVRNLGRHNLHPDPLLLRWLLSDDGARVVLLNQIGFSSRSATLSQLLHHILQPRLVDSNSKSLRESPFPQVRVSTYPFAKYQQTTVVVAPRCLWTGVVVNVRFSCLPRL